MVATQSAVTPYGCVPRAWPDETVVCLGTGASLTPEDVAYCQGRAKVIAIKDAIELAPWADCLYSCGDDTSRWWHAHGDALIWYEGLRFTLDPKAAAWAIVLKNTGFTGLEMEPTGLRTGKNSGYQAINLAVLLGATRIVLLGYDMQVGPGDRDHFFGQHPRGQRPPYADFRPLFDLLVEPLADLGVSIVNATRSTALRCFPQMSLEEALA